MPLSEDLADPRLKVAFPGPRRPRGRRAETARALGMGDADGPEAACLAHHSL